MVDRSCPVLLLLLGTSAAFAQDVELDDSDIRTIRSVIATHYEGKILSIDHPEPRPPSPESNEDGSFKMSDLLAQIRLHGVYVVFLETGKSEPIRIPMHRCFDTWTLKHCRGNIVE